jgi:protein TonB
MKEKTNKKDKEFLKIPEYPGGKKALLDFIKNHLQYPADALAKKTEGVVSVAFEVNDMGKVENPKIIKGLTPSCNEEALRVVKLLTFGQAHNHGIRLKSNHKINIHFKPPLMQNVNMQFSYTPPEEEKPKPADKKEEYSYSIHIPQYNPFEDKE